MKQMPTVPSERDNRIQETFSFIKWLINNKKFIYIYDEHDPKDNTILIKGDWKELYDSYFPEHVK